MKLINYIKNALSPGGTPTSYALWVMIVYYGQVLTSTLPSNDLFTGEWNHAVTFLLVAAIIGLTPLFFKSDKKKIYAAYFLYIAGLGVSVYTILTGLSDLTGIVFMLTWAMTLFVAERREYIPFTSVTVFSVLMLISTVAILEGYAVSDFNSRSYVLYAGAFYTVIDIYLIYIDFGRGKNFYTESRESFTNLDYLSDELSRILSAQNELKDLLWEVAERCVPLLKIEDCVIYLYDEEDGLLKQVAAYGQKSIDANEILEPIVIEPGKGIVGKAYSTGDYVVVDNLFSNQDYILDDKQRSSELAVPILSNGIALGVIDSEHSSIGFFKERHVQAFRIMAAFCGIKIAELKAQMQVVEAEKVKQEAARFMELDQLKNRFITNISHDLKTPLSLIKAPAMQIARAAEEENIKNNANYILKNADHLLRVVNQLLQLNRVDQGLNELYLEKVSLKKLVTKIETQYKGLVEKDNVIFNAKTVDLIIETDSFRLEQLIHNLVHNAFRYSLKEGYVQLLVEARNDVLYITVSDNGPGIPPEMHESIFDRFVKVDVNNHEGTGIGLSLVKEYANSLGGTVKLQSELGKGATFIVEIPIKVDKEAAINEEETIDNELFINSKPVLLIVEDHADLNNFISQSFEEEYNCISAFNGAEALIKCKQSLPDIIITDLMMPNMGGTELILQIRENDEWSHVPIIVLSAKGQVESKIELYELGVDNYLVKPFDITELEAVVKATLERRRGLKNDFQSMYLGNKTEPLEKEMESTKIAIVDQLVDLVIQRIEESDLNVSFIGQELGIGRNRLQKEVKDATGLTPVELIRSIRLQKAKEQLVESDLTISEIAFGVGFNSLSYFTRSFKQEFGVLPSEVERI